MSSSDPFGGSHHRDPPVKLGDDIERNFRNDEILDGILDEIASVALPPRNDEGNSRILYRDPWVKPEDDIVGNFR